MLNKLRPYAWFSLIIALLSTIFSGGYYYIKRVFDLPLMISVSFTVIGLALYALINPDAIRKFFTGRQIKYASNAIIEIIAVAAILIAINFIVNKQAKEWDFTADLVNTLSPQTIEILQNLPGKVEALAFASDQYPKDDLPTLLTNLAQNSNGKLIYHIIDPNQDPVSAKTYKITTDGTIIFLLNGFQQETKITSESEIATALVKLSNPNASVVYFLTGHGERDPFSTGDESYSSFKEQLEKKNYVIKPLNLLVDPKIPIDATAIVITGPQKPVSKEEVNLLKEYSNSGKSLVVFEDARVITDFGDEVDPIADYLLSDWGMKLNDDFVVDMNSNPPSQVIASQYGDHPITQRMAGIVSIFPSTRSITLHDPSPENLQITGLVYTSANSWGETDLDGLKKDQLQFDKQSDFQGPLVLGASAQNLVTKSRLVVLGSSYFAMNKNFEVYGNGDLAINIIDWVTENEQLIKLSTRVITQRILVPPSQTVVSMLFLLTIVLIPGCIIAAGITVWINRRKRN